MKNKEKRFTIEDIVKERIKFYAGISTEGDVFMEKFKVLKHPQVIGGFFIYMKFLLKENEIFSSFREIEGLHPQVGWAKASVDWKDEEIDEFLKDCQDTNFDVSRVKLK
jgi:hypothetical protein